MIQRLSLGGNAIVILGKQTKPIRVAGFWRFDPTPPAREPALLSLMDDNTLPRQARVLPCTFRDAQLVTNREMEFFDINHVVRGEPYEPKGVLITKLLHDKIIKDVEVNGRASQWGAIFLPVEKFPERVNRDGTLR